MPEGPEVRLASKILNDELSNLYIQRVSVTSPKYEYFKKDAAAITRLARSIRYSIKIKSVKCKGKLLWINLERIDIHSGTRSSRVISSSLGLVGKWLIDDETPGAIQIIVANYPNDDFTARRIVYCDHLGFGKIHFESNEQLAARLQRLGPDASYISEESFRAAIQRHPAKQITHLLTDQKIISGIGQYVLRHILHHTGVDPAKICRTLTHREIKNIHKAIIHVMNDAYSAGGGNKYPNPYGIKGTFSIYTKL